ncbi:MAG: D-tyrosyl-tRNA(Tyr) deacylase [Pseudomonadales bacterium]|nr:D-tyrosyl-tRNA(Tyr) deacylase [Pseudomonadales bacterium]
MKTLLQRVISAKVVVEGKAIGEIEKGILVFLAIEKGDTEERIKRMAQRVLNYRLFSDDDDKMNLNVTQVQGGVLAVSQFTLAANTGKGNRPSFIAAADPALGKPLYQLFVSQLSAQHSPVATGSFGADMQVHLVNDGPVTFWLEI